MHKIRSALPLLLALLPNLLYGATLQDKVTVSVPANWELITAKSSATLVANAYHARTDTIGAETHYSNALVQYYTVPASFALAQADDVVASHTRGATLIVSAQDGPHWKTYLLISYERNEQYIVFYRIGIFDGVCLEVMLSFPHVRDEKKTSTHVLTLNEAYVRDKKMAGVFCDPSAVKDMVDVFNDLCSKLRISGSGEFRADVRIVRQPDTIAGVYRRKADQDGGN
jgi:hypothetical protein